MSDLGPAFGIPDSIRRRKTYVNPQQVAEEEDEKQVTYAMVNAYASHTIDYHDGIQEPRSYSEAVKSPQAGEWKKAMLAELDAIQK